MSDPTEEPAPADAPADAGIWYRYRHAAMWIRIAIPVAALVILIGAGALIANAVSDDSSSVAGSTTTTAPGNNTILLLVATQLATDETSTTEPTTTIPPETIPPETTTVASVPVDTTTPSTEPPTTSTAVTEPVTEPASTAPPTTPSPPSTTAKATTTTEEATTTTEAPTTTTEAPATTSTVVLPPGQVAASPQAFREAWNTAAAGTGVASITTWTQEPIAGNTGNVADLGGNIRLVLLSDGDATPVSAAVLAWLPLTDPATQAEQNETFQHAFAVLTETVNPAVTAEQQATLSAQLGLGATAPPFAAGASANASLAPQQYLLRALVPSGQSGVYTLVGVSALA